MIPSAKRVDRFAWAHHRGFTAAFRASKPHPDFEIERVLDPSYFSRPLCGRLSYQIFSPRYSLYRNLIFGYAYTNAGEGFRTKRST